MGKKYAGKPCVYCSEALSATGDHVFSRKFFLKEHRANLPKVPSCARCNGEKSKLELYLLSVLPFGGRHKGAKENLASQVPGRLSKNARLHQKLLSRQGATWAQSASLVLPTMTLPFNSEKLKALFRLIAKGLIWHHWGTCLTTDHFVDAYLPTTTGELILDQSVFNRNASNRVTQDLGEGTVVYEGLQGVDCPQVTAWRFWMYGGVVLCGDPEDPRSRTSRIDVLSGPACVRRDAELTAKFA